MLLRERMEFSIFFIKVIQMGSGQLLRIKIDTQCVRIGWSNIHLNFGLLEFLIKFKL